MAKKENNKSSSQSPKPRNKKPSHAEEIEAKAPVEPTNREQGLTIVGIGASAGGLIALRFFFETLPVDTGMAFVVVTHLHPEHESHLAELLQKSTSMPTEQVTKRTKVEKNHVYVIPPNRSIIMTNTHLDTREFDEPHGRRTPIDHFFRSMAASGHADPIAIILSGGGTDGSVGIKDVKEVGGLIMVQHPKDAEYDSMPRAAMTTGLVDVILPAAQLAEKLADYAQHRPQLPHDPGQLSEAETETLQRILAQVHAPTGHDFTQYKRSTILRRVERRMQLNGFDTLDAYLAYLRGNVGEAQAMFNDILIGVTNFFRDREPWEALQEKILPVLFQKKQGGDTAEGIRIWSIGCATGEEAYGLGILLLEECDRQGFTPPLQIFASDLDERSIAHARDGLYPAAIEADVSPERLERFFTREGEYYRVKRELRDIVLFTNHNVMRDPPFSRQDLIACRNVLIYLQRPVQDRVFDIFHYALHPEGYLFLGSSESAEHIPDLFSTIDKAHRIYKCRSVGNERPFVPSMPLSVRNVKTTFSPDILNRPQRGRYIDEPLVMEEQHRNSLEAYGPPSVIVNERYAILHVSETAGRYLHQPKGPITGDLITLMRPELQLEVRSALFHAFEKGKPTVSRAVAVQFNGHKRRVLAFVRPRPEDLSLDRVTEREALVFFIEDEIQNADESLEAVHAPRTEAERDQVVAQLQSELQHVREQLQITMEEYESSNEEMKAANEELQSINEEYRSATEELETSKEELQSVNEELQTVNSEMRVKLDETSAAHRELENLMGATEIATLYLDRDLKIKRFTAGVQELFSVLPFDRGRSISDLRHKLGYENFVQDAEQVLRSLVPLEREIQKEDGTWYVMRMRPYRTREDRIEGVVISFIDITKLKKTEAELLKIRQGLEEHAKARTVQLEEATSQLRQAHDLFENLFEVNPVPISLTKLEDGTFIRVNDAYLHYFDLKDENLRGRNAQELGLPLEPSIRPRLIARVQKQGSVRNIEMETKLPSGEVRTILVSVQIVKVDNGDALMLAFIDITEHVIAERKVRTAANSLSVSDQIERQRISQILHDELQQNIFAVKMQLSFLDDAIKQNNPAAANVDLKQLDQWLAEAIATTRQLSIDLSPPVLPGEGLTESLLWLASQMKTQYNLEVNIEPNGTQAVLDDDVRSLLFQSVRELLFNVVKHSGRLDALVTLEQINGEVRIIVSDKGRGFDMKSKTDKDFNGLRKMRDRLYLVGANLKIQSEPERGTQITIEAPVANSME